MLARVARLGPATDHELLLVLQFQLAPCRAAPARLIRRPRFLDDQPLPALGLRARMQRAAVADRLLADANRARLCGRAFLDDALEARAALDERQTAHIIVAFAQQIERDEGHRLLAIDALYVFRVDEVNAALKALESERPAFGIERDDLAVDDERVADGSRERFERVRRSTETAMSSHCRGATTTVRWASRARRGRARSRRARECRRTSVRRRALCR